MLLCQALQRRRHVGWKRRAGARLGRAGSVASARGETQIVGAVEPVEHPPPVLRRARAFLPAEPRDVVGIGTGGRKPEVPSCHERVVGRSQIVQHDRKRPAVEQDVMERPDDLIAIGVQSQQRQPHQRRFRQLEPAPPIFVEQALERGRTHLGREIAPVGVRDRDRCLASDHLERALEVLPHHR